MSSLARFEFKYVLTEYQARDVIASLAGRMQLDEHSSWDGYFVRSLYYDTRDYHFLRQKIDGEFIRMKLRLRTYDRPGAVSRVNAEIKTRIGEKIVKHVFPAKVQGEGLSGLRVEGSGDFLHLCHSLCLEPKVLIDYTRLAFASKHPPYLRVTLDRDMRAKRAGMLNNAVEDMRRIDSGTILEIKTQDEIPAWLSNLIRNHRTMAQPNSKYMLAAIMECPDILMT